MLTATAVKRWHAVHKWSSLISLLFMLTAFGSGLPLVFGEEIYRLEQWLVAEAADAGAGNETALPLDALISRARQARPGTALQLIYRDRIDPRATYFALGKHVAAPLIDSEFLRIDNFSGEYLGAEFYAEGVMGFFLLLHTQLFMGLGGTLLLGLIGLLFLLALLSGVVLYAPFMRQRSFAVIRLDRGRRGRWLDLHNAAGIVLLTWAFVVGATGVVNTVDDLLIHYWLHNDLQQITAADPVTANATGRLTSVQRALELGAEALPDGEFNFMTFPGAEYSSDRHYLVFFNGLTPLSAQLLRVAVINAYSGELIATPAMPWYIIMPLLAQPLHYGNYGGIGLKIAWALLCLATIALLLSGLALWWQKRRDPPELEPRPPAPAA